MVLTAKQQRVKEQAACFKESEKLDIRMRRHLQSSSKDQKQFDELINRSYQIKIAFRRLITILKATPVEERDADWQCELAMVHYNQGSHYKQTAWFHYYLKDLQSAANENHLAIKSMKVSCKYYNDAGETQAASETQAVIKLYTEQAAVLDEEIKAECKSSKRPLSRSREDDKADDKTCDDNDAHARKKATTKPLQNLCVITDETIELLKRPAYLRPPSSSSTETSSRSPYAEWKFYRKLNPSKNSMYFFQDTEEVTSHSSNSVPQTDKKLLSENDEVTGVPTPGSTTSTNHG